MAVSQDTGPFNPHRRSVVAAVGVTGLSAAMTACGGSDDTTPEGAASTPEEATGDAGGTALARTADIPEGGGTVFKEDGVVVTQPTAGEFKAFSSTCTHQGCTVRDVADGTINCPCHGSKFHMADGSVAHGPATRPLPSAKIVVSGGEITLS